MTNILVSKCVKTQALQGHWRSLRIALIHEVLSATIHRSGTSDMCLHVGRNEPLNLKIDTLIK